MTSEFVCDRCGKCCRTHRVPVTDTDLRRLNEAGISPDHAIELLGAEQVEMEGEPESFVLLKEGRRLVVLRHESGGADSQCTFLGEDGCTIHQSRPSACRAYPYDRPEPGEALGLHPQLVCPSDTNYRLPLLVHSTTASSWRGTIAERDAELHAYASRVEQWNRRQRTRIKMGKTPQSRAQLLAALLVP